MGGEKEVFESIIVRKLLRSVLTSENFNISCVVKIFEGIRISGL